MQEHCKDNKLFGNKKEISEIFLEIDHKLYEFHSRLSLQNSSITQ